MKLFIQWARLHKIKFTLLVLYAFACGAILRADVVWGLVVMAIGYGAWTVIYMLDTNRMLAALVAASLLAVPSTRAQEFKPAAPYVIGGLVIIVGAGLGYVGCRVVKACKKIARKSGTNAPPEELQFMVAGEPGEYGMAAFWQEPGYCLAERLLPVEPTVVTLNIAVQSVSNATVTVSASTGQEFVQSWGEFTEELESHGLAVTAGQHFSRNRHPVTAEQVAITFNTATRVARIGAGGVLVSIERSADLREWEPLAAINTAPRSLPLRFEDCSSVQQFYRVKLSTP